MSDKPRQDLPVGGARDDRNDDVRNDLHVHPLFTNTLPSNRQWIYPQANKAAAKMLCQTVSVLQLPRPRLTSGIAVQNAFISFQAPVFRPATTWFLEILIALIKTKICNRVDCQRSEKRSKTHKKLKERFLIIRNRTKRANFPCNHLFRATYNTIESS